ncbi:MAG: hypothetical protein CVU39_14580 [Chloroflexi bacterium HGW-Chloroflexi-10]|nr:MAG: hypothetical protein CVU39_14580 [Chloroflexi bacterium HGW-Chloroflexi-10]
MYTEAEPIKQICRKLEMQGLRGTIAQIVMIVRLPKSPYSLCSSECWFVGPVPHHCFDVSGLPYKNRSDYCAAFKSWRLVNIIISVDKNGENEWLI